MVDKTERMTSKEFLARTTITPAGKKLLGQAPPEVQPTGNLFQGVRPAIYIGIDPGSFTGFATWFARKGNTPGRFLEVTTLTFWAAIQRIDKLTQEFGPAALRVRIEDVRGNKPTFRERDGNAAVRERMSQNIGSNKRDCQLLIEYIEAKGIPLDALVPKKKASGAGKVGAELFAGAVGFPVRSSQHARDAAFLILGL